jgi:hypothetical protein
MGLDVDAYHPIGARIDGRNRLSDSTARRLRLRAADRLERDIRRLARGEGLEPEIERLPVS